MITDMITLAVTGSEVAECAGLGLRLMHLAYRVSPSGNLLRSNAFAVTRGGIMALTCAASTRFEVSALCRMVTNECAAKRFEGVFLDFEEYSPRLSTFASELEGILTKKGLRLYVNLKFSEIENSYMLESSEVTGGSFRYYIRELREKYADRLTLEIVPLAVDFTLPSNGTGSNIDEKRLGELLDNGVSCYYSRELCAKYFTYKAADRQTHFVIYDDAYTIREKLEAAYGEGVREAFLPYTRLKNELPDILGV